MEHAQIYPSHPNLLHFLDDWYESRQLDSKRSEMADFLRNLSNEQRSEGGIHEALGKIALPNLDKVSVVFKEN